MTPTDERTILTFAIAGHTPDWICQAMPGIKPDAVHEVLQAYGAPNKTKMQAGLVELSGGSSIPVRLAPVPATVTRPAVASTAATTLETLEVTNDAPAQTGWNAILDRAKKSKRTATRNEAARIQDRLQALADRLAADDKVEAAKVRAAHEKQQALDDVKAARAALDAALAKARAATTKPTANTVHGGTTSNSQRMAALGVQTADVRAWAVANNVGCPTRGVLPTAVLDAYQAAHHEESA